MKLPKVRVQNERSVEDSGEFEIGDLTCLVGKNEAGKTALLSAMRGLKPPDVLAHRDGWVGIRRATNRGHVAPRRNLRDLIDRCQQGGRLFDSEGPEHHCAGLKVQPATMFGGSIRYRVEQRELHRPIRSRHGK